MDAAWVTQPSDRGEQEAREVYALAGLALYNAQCLEHGIVNILMSVAEIKTLRKVRKKPALHAKYRSYIDNLWGEAFRKTLGALIKSLHEADIKVSLMIEDDLNRCREERNRLVHRYFRQRAELFQTPAGRRAMAEELTDMLDLFAKTDRALDEIDAALREALGVTDCRVDRYVALLREGVGADQIADIVAEEPHQGTGGSKCSPSNE